MGERDAEEKTVENKGRKAATEPPYRDFPVRHQDGKVGEVVAGARRVRLVGLQEFAALRGPVTHHAPLRVIPKGAIGVEVVLHLQITRDMLKCPNN